MTKKDLFKVTKEYSKLNGVVPIFRMNRVFRKELKMSKKIKFLLWLEEKIMRLVEKYCAYVQRQITKDVMRKLQRSFAQRVDGAVFKELDYACKK